MFKFDPIIKTIPQARQYFNQLLPRYDPTKWTLDDSNIDRIIDIINDGKPLPQIEYCVKTNTILDNLSTDTYITIELLVSNLKSKTILYINIETGMVTKEYIDYYITPRSYIFFNSVELLKFQRSIKFLPQEKIDMLDNIYAKMNHYKIVINELYQI